MEKTSMCPGANEGDSDSGMMNIPQKRKIQKLIPLSKKKKEFTNKTWKLWKTNKDEAIGNMQTRKM